MKTAIKRIRQSPGLLCLAGGWILGALIFYLSDSLGWNKPTFDTGTLTAPNVCDAIFSQARLFLLVTILGFSMLSGIIPPAIVLLKSTVSSFSCALVCSSSTLQSALNINPAAFTLTSVLICVFLTSSARLAHIFYTKVPHDRAQNILDYIARQIFTIGFTASAMIIYFAICAIT